ncbi:MAG TPA: MBL fold metallo-hydrolase [Candidatus Eremiobacteraceae bacterium]|nr:MBL fold metallo-hydrolase [Candidatus Eremiobacteraceae bacterium]
MASITFIGAAGVVTGSKHLIETTEGRRVLLDCGMYQGEKDLEARNWTPPPVDPKTVDAVILSHGHLDHCGYLPALVQAGFKGPIHTTPATMEVASLVLYDSAHLQEDEAQRAAKHPNRGLHATPLYTQDDVDKVVAQFKPAEYGAMCDDIAGLRYRLSDAGHILGSAITELWFDQRKLTFTGDLGRYGRPLLNDPSPVAESDLVLAESTYGDRLHPASDPQVDLGKVINAAMARKGVLVIPSFAVGRTQELLYAIGQLQRDSTIPDVNIFVDSPMAISADAIMERHPEAMRFNPKARFGPGDESLGARNVKTTVASADSIMLNDIQTGAIILSASGMASGGRILHHLRNRLPRPNDTICFVGYQASGTLGSLLEGGAKSVRVLGVPVDVKANVVQIDGFSAHADRGELLRWFANFTGKPRTYLVHADPAAAQSLADAIGKKYGFTVTPAHAGERVEIV